ncbi:Calcium-binding EF-hand [Cynara cardunculus var. scolymus]|uniref:Calcium-binding EF-hand n=1 Tax=Cynara cardunculus var. scolymus TaxID=59895 RepID=A0A103XRY5_CYNCS|nr:Calcium-binding EF-hand [Cynara cardunculus var. scolymus]
MGKVSVIIYITIALLLLLLISQSPNKSNNRNNNRRHRRLKLRSNFSFTPTTTTTAAAEHHVSFDPLVADIERKREDRLWEKSHFFDDHHHEGEEEPEAHAAPGMESQPEWEDFIDAEDYLNDEHKFNITHRLVLLFPRIDVDPSDGFVTEHELTEWNLEQSQREVLHRSQREMELHDKNHDGLVSFAEYQPPTWVRDSDNNSFGYDMGWWKEEHFNASDADEDGFLNITEFNEERDTDKDGKVNFKEFFHGLFDLVRNYDEDGHNSSHESSDSLESPARTFFAELDKDGDGYLSDVELLPIIGKLHPSERYYAKQQADYIISQADTDKDGRLSLTEMIDSPYVFYSAIFNEDEDEDYEYHDEFR